MPPSCMPSTHAAVIAGVPIKAPQVCTTTKTVKFVPSFPSLSCEAAVASDRAAAKKNTGKAVPKAAIHSAATSSEPRYRVYF